MSPLEDEVRDTLRAAAAQLDEIRPLRLPTGAAPPGRRPGPVVRFTRWARWLRAWLGSLVAVVAVATDPFRRAAHCSARG